MLVIFVVVLLSTNIKAPPWWELQEIIEAKQDHEESNGQAAKDEVGSPINPERHLSISLATIATIKFTFTITAIIQRREKHADCWGLSSSSLSPISSQWGDDRRKKHAEGYCCLEQNQQAGGRELNLGREEGVTIFGILASTYPSSSDWFLRCWVKIKSKFLLTRGPWEAVCTSWAEEDWTLIWHEFLMTGLWNKICLY